MTYWVAVKRRTVNKLFRYSSTHKANLALRSNYDLNYLLIYAHTAQFAVRNLVIVLARVVKLAESSKIVVRLLLRITLVLIQCSKRVVFCN